MVIKEPCARICVHMWGILGDKYPEIEMLSWPVLNFGRCPVSSHKVVPVYTPTNLELVCVPPLLEMLLWFNLSRRSGISGVPDPNGTPIPLCLAPALRTLARAGRVCARLMQPVCLGHLASVWCCVHTLPFSLELPVL